MLFPFPYLSTFTPTFPFRQCLFVGEIYANSRIMKLNLEEVRRERFLGFTEVRKKFLQLNKQLVTGFSLFERLQPRPHLPEFNLILIKSPQHLSSFL